MRNGSNMFKSPADFHGSDWYFRINHWMHPFLCGFPEAQMWCQILGGKPEVFPDVLHLHGEPHNPKKKAQNLVDSPVIPSPIFYCFLFFWGEVCRKPWFFLPLNWWLNHTVLSDMSWGYPQSSSIFVMGFSINHPAIGVSHLWKPSLSIIVP